MALAITQASTSAVEPEAGNPQPASGGCPNGPCPGDFCYKRVPPCYYDRFAPRTDAVSEAESEVTAVEAEDSAPTGYKCTKDNGVWECTGYGRILSDNLDQDASPTRLPCRWIGKELYCDGVKK
ncbi:hypothetical protein EC991_010595 [Linnemannia zychae]|nr:hypothetical protein EC991_010595 [Linnemannia zychae]